MFVDEKHIAPILAPTLEPWQEHLLGAAKVLREHGHQKNVLKGPNGFCAIGAINQAAHGDHEHRGDAREAVVRFASYLKARGVRSAHEVWGPHMVVADWNNARERTAEEVISALEEAAHVR